MSVLNFFMCISCILYSLLFRTTNAQHIFINNILYTVSTPTCFNANVTREVNFVLYVMDLPFVGVSCMLVGCEPNWE